MQPSRQDWLFPARPLDLPRRRRFNANEVQGTTCKSQRQGKRLHVGGRVGAETGLCYCSRWNGAVREFRVVACTACGTGVLNPDVVFFGENVPPQRVTACRGLVGEAAALLVLGSSLTVMSGLRFIRQAAQSRTPVLIVNQGPTRGNRWADRRIDLPPQ
ncbi:hypothetical protein E2651_03790 [Streptomyces sp. MZ04]|nr:hypothetical protein E2651_03790 [Streptomyces sp. MZ04]